MRNDGSVFEAAMKKNADFEDVAKTMHSVMTDLSMEIVQKPAAIQTEAEKAFVKGFLRLMIMGLMDGPIGGKS